MTAADPPATATPVTVVVAVTARAQAGARAAVAWLAAADGGPVSVLVAVPAGRLRLRHALDEALAGAAAPGTGDAAALRVLPVRRARTAAALWRAAAEQTDGSGVVVLADGTGRPGPLTVPTLVSALRSGGGEAAVPVLAGVPALAADDALAHAGFVSAGPGRPPWPLLAGHPAEDVAEADPVLPVPLLAAAPLALRATDLPTVLSVLPADAGPASAVAALTSAIGHVGLAVTGPERIRFACVRGALMAPAAGAGDDTAAESGGAESGGAEADPGPWPDLPAWEGPTLTLRRAGLSVRAGQDGPAVARSPTPERARWAIVTASPAGPGGEAWGDTHFAGDLAAALRRADQQVAVIRRPAAVSPARARDDVVVVLRGLARVDPVPGPTWVLWVISHPDLVEDDEASAYDLLAAASSTWSQVAAQRWDRPVEPLLQATDPVRFNPGLAAPDTGDPVLFVGNSRRQDRPMVRWALEAGADLAVYGSGWDGLPPGVVRGRFLPPQGVGAAYRAAGIVLNDHWPDMAREGFLSNRLFDAVAAGARVVSDDAAGLAEVFGPSVRVVSGADELGAVLAGPADDVVGDDAARLAAAAWAAREHSFDARASELLRLVRGAAPTDPG